MKKTTAFIVAIAMILSFLVLAAPAARAEEAEAKLGLGVITDITGSTSATEDEDGRAKVDVTVVAVLLDAEDKILDVKIDVMQPYTFFSAEGAVAETKSFQTKRELKEAYGMLVASEIGKEWFEQGEALEDYMIGKTVEDVLAMEVNEEYRPTDTDLSASVTVHVDSYLAALEKAAANAKAVGSMVGDSLGLGIVGDNNRSKDVADDADGLTQAYLHLTALTVNAEGVVTAAMVDALQANINFDAEGQITSDLEAEVKTKTELGDEYGMKAASGIGKEWYEQADAFAQYVVGKTAADIEGMGVEDGNATDEDLLASVTITVTGMQEAVLKAIADATGAAVSEESAEEGVKTGLAVLTAVDGSTSAEGEENGRAKVDITVVAVLLDTDGTILDVKIDVVQPYTSWDAEGKLVETKEFMTKRELGDEYGMRAASGIGAEWFEQAAAFEEFVTGKTLEDVLAIELDEESRPVDADLAASVTVHVDQYLLALEKAVETAKVLGASAEDGLGLGIAAHTLRSKDAGEEDGLAQAYVHYGALTFNADGQVTSAIIDASQANINFDAAGQITTDLTAAQLTKLELGEDYGMKAASAIGKEWDEQAEAYSVFIVGKTLEEILELADEAGEVTDTDLLASVTIGIDAMQAVVQKAYEDAFVMAE